MFQIVALTPTVTGGPDYGSQQTQTGAQTFPGVNIDSYKIIGFEFVVTAASGGTQTVTWQIQGSVDDPAVSDLNANWYPIAYITDSSDTMSVAGRAITAAGAQLQWMDTPTARRYRRFRLVTSAYTATVNYYCNAYKISD